MQNSLKQFTKCSSLTTFFTVFVILFSLSSTALTTFGISKTPSNPAQVTVAPTVRECIKNEDCADIPHTSCVKNFDYRLRCLCGDYSSPVDGFCSTQLKGLHHQCTYTEDCEDHMICLEKNTTRPSLLSDTSNIKKPEKLCYCDEEIGFFENLIDKQCNNAVKTFNTNVVAVFFCYIVIQKFLQY